MPGPVSHGVSEEYYERAYKILLGLIASRAETAMGRSFVVKRIVKNEDKIMVVNSKNTEIVFKISSFAKALEHLVGFGGVIQGVRGKSENSVENIIGTEATFALPYLWGLLTRIPGVERDTNNVIRAVTKPEQVEKENPLSMDYRELMEKRKKD